MANFTFTPITHTVGSTEYSLVFGATYSAGTSKTILGYVQAVIDLSAMASSDHFRVRVYEKANSGTQNPVYDTTFVDAQTVPLIATPLLLLGEGWDVTIQKTAGTDRSIKSSVRQDTNDVNTATISTDAVSAAALKTDATTEIAAAIWSAIGEGSNTYGDLIRGVTSAVIGRVTNFLTGTLVFKSLNAAKTRWTVTTNTTGRLTLTVGDLT